jgi:hypothetical protein
MRIIINYKIPNYKDNKIFKFNSLAKIIIELNDNINKNIIKNIKGGDIFEDLNLEDIIIKKEIKTSIDNIKLDANKKLDDIKEKYIIDNLLLKKHKIDVKKEKNINIYTIKNINITILNSLYDIKLLIFYLLNISIENQYLYNTEFSDIFYNYKNVITQESIDINMESIINNTTLKYFNNIPIDFSLINNRYNYILSTFEKQNFLNELISLDNNSIEFNFVNLYDFINNKTILYNEIQKDDELLDIIYKGFIEKYFPYYDDNLFMLYLSNENKYLEYPNLKIQKDNIISKCEYLNTIYSIKSNKNINYISKYYKKLIYQISSFNDIKIINVQDLFNNIEIIKFKNIKKIELRILVNENYIYFNKLNIINIINQKDNTNNLETLYINNKNINTLLNTNYINDKNLLLIVYNIKIDKDEIDDDLILLLDEYDNIYIIYNINKYNVTDLSKYEKIILKYINDFLTSLYEYKIIKKNKQITLLNLNLLIFDYLILFNSTLGLNEFNIFINKIKEYQIIDFYNINNIDNINNIIELSITKINQLNKNIDYNQLNNINNYYQYYIKTILNEKYNKIVFNSFINITNRIKDIKIDLINITNDEFIYIYKFLLFILEEFTKNIKTSNIVNKSNSSINKLKNLKEIDPILYNINKKNTKNLYSRKCQSSQQPEIITEKEIKQKKIKNAIKYHNFTTGDSIYYYCNSKKFPTVKFLTNIHPNNYCIPCCKKKSLEDIKIKSKYVDIHKECLNNFTYDKKKIVNDEKSRYIMNYSSKILIENLRLMQIPDTLNKLFKKLYDINENTQQIYNYYILGLNQDLNNISNIGILFILSFILDKTIYDTIEFIKSLFIDNKDFIAKIYNGNLLKYFNSSKEFLLIFTNIFQNTLLINNINYEFNDWNNLFMDIAKYLGYIFIIFEENENLNLIIPSNTKYINEYIYNNDNYKYILLIKRNYNKKELYYPIINVNYLEYYSKNLYNKKYYLYNDNIINLLIQIINKQLINNNLTSPLQLQIIEEFILLSNIYKIQKYYINKKYEIYGLLIENIAKNIKKSEKEYIYLLIDKQKIPNEYYNKEDINNKYEFNYIEINKYNIKLNNILSFIKEYNKYIYNINKAYYSEYILKLYINYISSNINFDNFVNLNTFIKNETKNNENLIDYIYINSFLTHNNKIIGVRIINNNLYISNNLEIGIGINLLKNKQLQIDKLLKNKKIKKDDIKILLTREFNTYKFNNINYLYNPHNINKIIYNTELKQDTRILKLNESIYYTNLYNLILLHFSHELNNIKNISIRTKLKVLINSFTNKDLLLIENNKYFKIKDLINKMIHTKESDNNLRIRIYNNIYKFIKDNIILIKQSTNNLSKIKKNIIINLDKTKFIFDTLYIYNILQLDKTKAIIELDNILKNIITDTHLNLKSNIINIELCNNITESYYCKNNKLIISKKIYKDLLEILYYDLNNPFKQKLILNLLNYNLNNIYKFRQYLNEKIFIYL